MTTDAITRWSADLARDPGSLAFLPLAEALRRQRRLDDALRVALRGLERHPYLADAHDLLARIAVDHQDEARARDEWEMALRIDPDHLSSLKGLGFLAFRRRDYATAERLLRAARARDPRDPGLEQAYQRVEHALANGANGRTNGHHAAMPAPVVTAASPAPGVPTDRSAQAARALFAPLLGDADRTALLLDRDGLVIAGTYVDEHGHEVGDEIGAQLAGLADEAARALTHLSLGTWESLVVEAPHASVALGPVAERAIVLVAAARDTQIGFVRRLLDRARRRAGQWLEGTS